MNWTKSQSDAINTDNKNLLISAGAGCGKTAILTNRIIRLMLEEKTDIDKFLVVTFTNAAASGMKEKIRKLLYSKIKEKNNDKRYLFDQISNLEKANISTLHSFCISVIREYYHLVDVDPAFKIIDSTNANILMDEAFDMLFEDRYKKEDKDFINTSISYSFNADEEEFKNILKEIYFFIYNRPNPFKWLREKVDLFNDDFNDIENSMFIDIIKDKINGYLSLALNYSSKAKDKAIRYEANDDLLEILNMDLDGLKNTQNLLINNLEKFITLKPADIFKRFKAGGLKGEEKAEVQNLRNESKDILKKALNILTFNYKDIIDVVHELYPHMKTIEQAIIDFDAYYSHLKSEKGVLEFKDTEHLCLKILEDEKAREEILSKFDYVFVDEYQDTNLVQEAIINKVIKENNLFTVGDVKQSIYRFRQAEPEIFLDRIKNYKKDEKINKTVYMNTNFRTNKNIITGINTLFEKIMSKKTGKINYDENERLIAGRDEEIESKIEVHLINKDTAGVDSFDSELSELSTEENEITYIALMINNLIGTDIYDPELKEYRKVKFSDICILHRSANTRIKNVKEIFNKYSIPVTSEKEIEYFKTLEIETIKDFLSIINNFKDDITLLSVMRSPIFNFTVDELLEIKISTRESHYYKSIMSFINKENVNITLKDKVKNMLKVINDYSDRSLYTSVPDLISNIYEETNIMDYMSALPFGNIRVNNMKTLLIKANEYESFSNEGLYGFINFMDYAKIQSESGYAFSEDSENSVNFMSIHKSKGLEFPIVILMGCHKMFNMLDTKKPIMLNKDLGICPSLIDLDNKYKVDSIFKICAKIVENNEILSEEMRLLYVALTRAKEKLILTAYSKDTKKLIDNLPSNITPYSVEFSNSYLEWIMQGILPNKIYEEENNIIYEDNNFIVYNNKIEDLLTELSTSYINQKDDDFYLDDKIINKIKDDLNFKYKNIVNTTIPRKAGVSSLKNVDLLEVGNNVINLSEAPKFKQEKSVLSSAEKGNIIHFIFEIIDIDKLKKTENIKAEIDTQIREFINKKMIKQEEVDNIDINYIYNFFDSNIGKELIHSKKIYRELPFNLALKAKDISEKWKDSEEEILVQGIIDLTFETKDGAMILVDYKTNHYNNESEKKELLKGFEIQLNYYKRAISTLMNKNVKHSYIYFLSKNEIEEV
ncbi:ATP-dependent nuclease subunit A [Anaerofustis stercorihominis DSM 17244]|uniref:DNA 3'-5' helicase n=1 Tax=Anaerofustis stercorihominis DSM 17244 TaxID=445971 RepID=B1C9D6_9FIRM|nr:helicase-exonuclease AddAB subunit AddA [Anaerofustis stercorihominis]EDS72300.1 ATP-dependent nuclease subunit A [Anaerofustis stercorihominis DSM 17244]